jgi:O-antigen/teichoic acid export membrane protein
MNAVGRKGIRLTSFAAIIIALANIFLNILLIPLIGIKGAIIATIISYILSFSIILSKRKYFYFPEAIE